MFIVVKACHYDSKEYQEVSLSETQLVVVEPYVDLDKEMQGKSDYDYIALDDHTPAVRYQRRKYIKELGLSKPIVLLRMAYGGSIGTSNRN